jgi:hypothetical protein
VEILGAVNAGIEMMGKKGSCDAQAKGGARHVVKYCVYRIGKRGILSHLVIGIHLTKELPAMTFTPAAWHVLIILESWSRFPCLEVKMYDTGA